MRLADAPFDVHFVRILPFPGRKRRSSGGVSTERSATVAPDGEGLPVSLRYEARGTTVMAQVEVGLDLGSAPFQMMRRLKSDREKLLETYHGCFVLNPMSGIIQET